MYILYKIYFTLPPIDLLLVIFFGGLYLLILAGAECLLGIALKTFGIKFVDCIECADIVLGDAYIVLFDELL